jgi:hypothetical protein
MISYKPFVKASTDKWISEDIALGSWHDLDLYIASHVQRSLALSKASAFLSSLGAISNLALALVLSMFLGYLHVIFWCERESCGEKKYSSGTTVIPRHFRQKTQAAA